MPGGSTARRWPSTAAAWPRWPPASFRRRKSGRTSVTTIDTDSATDPANALTEVRQVFASGRTRAPRWRVQQLRAIEQMCDEQESAIAAALASDLGRSAFEAWMGDVVSTRGE